MRLARVWDLTVRLLIGGFIGYLIFYLLDRNLSPCLSDMFQGSSGEPVPPASAGKSVPIDGKSKSPSRLLFVGVMTAAKFLDTRALSVYRTWGQKLPGQMAFFSSEGSTSSYPDLPLIALPGVTDAYPPQKKSFLMLKYMHDHLLDDFEWFMRADDDVFVRGDKMEDFLRSLNSSKPLFIGQAGMGNKDEFGMLSLAPGENFCMGGPGIIISREVLRRMAPNIQYCLKHLYSTHEDVEVGRCIRKFAGVPCAWSYEMQTIFYHNGSGSLAFTRDLHSKEVHRAITLHPVKTSQHLYRIQNYYNALKGSILRQEVVGLQRDVNDMNTFLYEKTDSALARPNLYRFRPQHPDEVLEWEFFSKTLYSHLDYNPRRSPKFSMKWALNDLIMQMMDSINRYSKQRGRIIDFKDLLYGFQRVDPLHAVHYVLDLHLVYRRYTGRKMTAPVRRHAHLEQAFGPLQLVEEQNCLGTGPAVYDLKRDFGDIIRYYSGGAGNFAKNSLSDEEYDCAVAAGNVTVHFIVPISGRLETLSRFLTVMEHVCFSRNESVSLTLMHFAQGLSSDGIAGKVRELKGRFPSHLIELVELAGNFSRARALQEGAARFLPNSLLFFVDVDMAFEGGLLHRVRRSTKLHRMVYYPVVFSQYDPKTNTETLENAFHLTEDNGYWRQFGYGIASMYRADFDAVGGFDLNITGWGKEDVDLFERFIKHGEGDTRFTVFRAVDPGLVHIYHPIICDAALSDAQLVMCLGTRAASVSGGRTLARSLLNDTEMLNAGWSGFTGSSALDSQTTTMPSAH
ncbi:Chondroitin sulfate synthase 1 [Hypsibius exemplaris]|uniref:Hexosyltransferase n=1 Tax=Hypsibius exemplaris TaxID=2072580 RepID=A0A1W0WHM2_HYPEX|nr:Chondroitin sulfate synthase 1 [Hypsibius exemplaris]